jgi:hypothetical protein
VCVSYTKGIDKETIQKLILVFVSALIFLWFLLLSLKTFVSGSHFKMGGYTALMPDMPKLGVMHSIGISNNILQIIGVDKYEKANQNHT